MDPRKWAIIESLYNAALAKEPSERTSYLAQACREHSELQAEVESLLRCAGEELNSPLEDDSTVRSLLEDVAFAPAPALGEVGAAAVNGRYHLLRLIGEGGMGEVWLAEQKKPVRRRVAVKLIKAGMNTREVMARFESERQALALMDHPAIAKVFDAGFTPAGRPCFVMEYVPGIPITDYCDKHKLTTRQRLELFIHVCEGVQHAHQKAIIHRDLKPSNILVSEVDRTPIPRIIDFGVAKAIGERLTAETMYTQVGAVIGTMGYMSPEQAELSREDVDTRSDVYSLGVVLYELLVGALPFDFCKIAFDEALRRLREEDAPKPSTKLRTQGVESTTTARNRATDVKTLARQVRGDPDAIALKALEKDRSRRYGSPSDLAADISRYLNNKPVLAVPPSVAYRARKFARRYSLALVTAAAFVLVLIAAAAVSIRQSIRANSEAAVAQAVNDFLQNDLLAQASANKQPGTQPDPDLKVRTTLERAAARIQGKFEQQPEVEAALRDTIGQTYLDLGLYPEARKQLERALELRRRVLGMENPKTLKTMTGLGWTCELQGKTGEAEALLSQALEVQRRVSGPEHPDTLAAMIALSDVYHEAGRYAQAEALSREAVRIGRRVMGPEHPTTLSAMEGIARERTALSEWAQAEAILEKTVDIRRRVMGPEHPDTIQSMDLLGASYSQLGKDALAEALHIQLLDIRRRLLGPEHPDTLLSINDLNTSYFAQGKFADAERVESQVVEISRRVLGPEHHQTLRYMSNLAEIYDAVGQYPRAEALFSRVVETKSRTLGPEHPSTLYTLASMVFMYQRRRKYGLAATYATQVLAGRRHTLGQEHASTIDAVADLALAYQSQGNFAESEPLARQAMEFYQKNERPDDWRRYRVESLLGASLAGQKKYAEAEPLLLEGYQGMVARKARIAVLERYHLDRARAWLVQLYKAWGKPEKAAEWRRN